MREELEEDQTVIRYKKQEALLVIYTAVKVRSFSVGSSISEVCVRPRENVPCSYSLTSTISRK